MNLTEFLLARIAEDEAVARASYYDGQVWIPEEEAVVAADRDLDPILYLDRKRDAAHAYRWSPARVLADIAAKRRIVEDYQYLNAMPGNSLSEYGRGKLAALEPILLDFASVHADHPDYRPEWAPEGVRQQ